MKLPQKTGAALNSSAAKPKQGAPEAQHRNRFKIYLLAGLALAGIIAAFLFPPIAQNPDYHNFADTRTLLSVPNFLDVLSNLPFILAGLAGLYSIASLKPKGMFPLLKPAYLLFFLGIFFTGIGSAYYHLSPDNATLLWDRLPMTIAFMAFFAIIIGEFISLKAGRKLLLPLLLLGVASVFYWHFTESRGHGDLRLYALVQFLPIILIPAIMLLFRAKTNTSLYTWLVVLAYLLAKASEIFDEEIYQLISLMSGHTLKHLLASLAPLFFLIGLYNRRLKQA